MTGGLLGLFFWGFLAATVFPVASEAALVAALLAGGDPWPCVWSATAGNTLGALTTWGLGRWGSGAVSRWLKLSEARERRARALFARYGAWSLLFSWVPVLGDPLCAVAGLLRLPFGRFLAPVLVGKLARYAVVAGLAGVV